MSKPDLPEIQGCTDGGCIFGHPGGMHTNGGCACLKGIHPQTLRLRIHRNVKLLRDEIERLRAVAEKAEPLIRQAVPSRSILSEEGVIDWQARRFEWLSDSAEAGQS